MAQHLVEVVRADFNGDGLEEILLFNYFYVTDGTFGSGGILILTRKAPDGLFRSSLLRSAICVIPQLVGATLAWSLLAGVSKPKVFRGP
jgi:hypothetical protein